MMGHCKRQTRRWQKVILSFLLILSFSLGGSQCDSPITLTPTGQIAPTHLGLAYYSERDGIANQGAIYLLDLASGKEQRLTGKGEAVTPYTGFSWSPASREFVYVAGIGNEAEIYTADVARQHRLRLTHNNVEESHPVWSPDGTQIAFLRRGGTYADQALRAYIMNMDGSEQRQQIDDPNVLSGGGVWSPDSRQFALLVTEVLPGGLEDGVLVVDVTSGDEILRIADGSKYRAIQWSHDGSNLALISDRDGLFQLYAMDMGTGKQRKLAEIENVLSVDWSPDDVWLAFSGSSSQGGFDIYRVRNDGTGLENLTNSSAYSVSCQWSPDGRRIVFSSLKGTKGTDLTGFEIYVMEVRERTSERVTNNSFLEGSAQWVEW